MPVEDIRQQNYNDELIKMKLQTISLNARPKVEKRAPVKQIVTQQQIDDYRSKLNKPVIVGGKKYKYSKPGEAPDLEEIDDTVIERVLNDEQIGLGRDLIKDYTNDYNKYIKDIKELEQQKKDKIYEVNNDPDYIKGIKMKNDLEQQKKDIEKEMINKKKLIKQMSNDIRNSEKIKIEKNDIIQLNIELDKIKKDIKDGEDFSENVEEYLNEQLEKLDDAIDEKKKEIEKVEKEITTIQQDIRENDQRKSVNQAEEQRVKAINRERVKNYQEQLNQLNSGQFSIIQQENETEQEWLERLKDMGETIFDDERIKLESNLYNVKELRKNLKEIIKDEVIIDDVIRTFNVVENDVYQLNTIFNPYIKNKFIKVYGKFNPRITEKMVVDFLNDILFQGKHGINKINDGVDDEDDDVVIDKDNLKDKNIPDDGDINTSSSNETTPPIDYSVGSMFSNLGSMLTDKLTGRPLALEYKPPKEEETKEEELKEEETKEEKKESKPYKKEKLGFDDEEYETKYVSDKFEIGVSNNIVRLFNYYGKGGGTKVYIKVGTNRQILLSRSGKPETFKVYGNTGISIYGQFIPWLGEHFKLYTKDDYPEIKKILAGGKGTAVEIHKFLQSEYGLIPISPDRVDYKGEQVKGWGVGLPEDIPKGLIPFGRCKLHLYKLYYDNEFVLKDLSGFNIPGVKNVKVSDDFVAIIMKIHNNENVNQSFIKKLSSNEQDLYDLFIFKCGFKNLDNDHKSKIDKLKSNLEVIQGEIEAGNDNKEILKELYDVLHQLAVYKCISLNDAKKHYNTIKNDYFKK